MVGQAVSRLLRSWRERRLVRISIISITVALLFMGAFALANQSGRCGPGCDELTGADLTSPSSTTVGAIGAGLYTTDPRVGVVGPTTTEPSVGPTADEGSGSDGATSSPTRISRTTAWSSGAPTRPRRWTQAAPSRAFHPPSRRRPPDQGRPPPRSRQPPPVGGPRRSSPLWPLGRPPSRQDPEEFPCPTPALPSASRWHPCPESATARPRRRAGLGPPAWEAESGALQPGVPGLGRGLPSPCSRSPSACCTGRPSWATSSPARWPRAHPST